MNVMIFSSKQTESAIKIQKMISGIVSKKKVFCVRNIKTLIKYIENPNFQQHVLLILIINTNELSRLVQHADILAQKKVILVLPDQDEKNITLGHRLYPRFLTFAGSDCHELIAVIGKMKSTPV